MLSSVNNVCNAEAYNQSVMQYQLPQIAKWKYRKIQAPIHHNIFIRFNKTISLGVIYYDVSNKAIRESGINIQEFFDFINNKASQQWKLTFYNTYVFTITLGYVQKNFKHWNDVENNMAWKVSVNGYLNTLRFAVFQAIQMLVLTPPIAHNPHNVHGNGYHQLATK